MPVRSNPLARAPQTRRKLHQACTLSLSAFCVRRVCWLAALLTAVLRLALQLVQRPERACLHAHCKLPVTGRLAHGSGMAAPSDKARKLASPPKALLTCSPERRLRATSSQSTRCGARALPFFEFSVTDVRAG